MTAAELLSLHFQELRRRSIKIWTSVPSEFFSWRPDKDAMSSQEMVRHVLESEHLYHVILERNGDARAYVSPWTGKPFVSIADEIEFAAPFREEYLRAVQGFSPTDLENREIVRADNGQQSRLGRYLLKVAYHEAVHAGQLLSYLRILGIGRPVIWD
jgi:uncharacterized damage-inducible protein DinB